MSDYYTDAERTMRDKQAAILARFPDLEDLANMPDPPRIRLLCPAGHHIVTAQIQAHYTGNLNLRPVLDDGYEAGRPVARRSDPAAATSSGTKVCAEPQCPVLVTGESTYCENHIAQGRADGHDDLDGVKVNLRCPQDGCRYDGQHRQERLVALYADAVRRGRTRIRLTA